MSIHYPTFPLTRSPVPQRARCARDECLRDLAGQLETAQRASLNELRDALLEMCRAEKLALVARQEALERLESSLHRVDPASDRRIFCHDARMRAWLADAGDARYSPLRDGARLIEPLAVRIRAVGTGAEGSARPRDTGSGAGVREGDEEEEDGEGSDDAASPAPRRHSQSPPTHVLDEACRGLVQRIFSGEAPARRREDAPLVRSAGASPDEPASGAYALAQAVRGLDACPSSVAAVPLRSRSVRAALLRVLNAQRSARTAVGAGFDTLASILWVLLDAAAAEGDVHAAKSAMILSQTFYREDTSAAAPTVGQDPGATEAQGRRHRRFLQVRALHVVATFSLLRWRCVLTHAVRRASWPGTRCGSRCTSGRRRFSPRCGRRRPRTSRRRSSASSKRGSSRRKVRSSLPNAPLSTSLPPR